MPRPTHLLLIAGLFSLSAGALAQQPGPSPTGPGGPKLARPVAPPASRTELKAQLEARFERMDANHDGKVDDKDPAARRSEAIATRFAAIDTDRNGAISREEFAAAGRDRAQAKRGGPARLSRAMMFRRDGRRMMMRGPLPFSPPPGGPAMHGPERKAGEPLTKSAFVDAGLARFDRVDTDRDGTISAAERDAVRGPMRGHRGRPKSPPPPPTPPSGQ